MDRQSSAPGASAISEGSGNLGMSFMNDLLSWVRTAHAGIAGKGESMANSTISGHQNLGQAPTGGIRPGGARPPTG